MTSSDGQLCPDCGQRLHSTNVSDIVPIAEHRGDEMCLAAQQLMRLPDAREGFVRIGNFWRTVASAGVTIRWLPSSMEYVERLGGDDEQRDRMTLRYSRWAPTWAFAIARYTKIPTKLRREALRRANADAEWRDATLAAISLGKTQDERERIASDIIRAEWGAFHEAEGR